MFPCVLVEPPLFAVLTQWPFWLWIFCAVIAHELACTFVSGENGLPQLNSHIFIVKGILQKSVTIPNEFLTLSFSH